jgi:hypothetical protein
MCVPTLQTGLADWLASSAATYVLNEVHPGGKQYTFNLKVGGKDSGPASCHPPWNTRPPASRPSILSHVGCFHARQELQKHMTI